MLTQDERSSYRTRHLVKGNYLPPWHDLLDIGYLAK